MRPIASTLALVACLLVAAPIPALAAEEEALAPLPERRVASWFAPFDDEPGQTVLLFGLLPTAANEGRLDRVLRLGAAGGLGYLAALDPLALGQPTRIGLAVVGGVLGWTGLTGSCPAYLPFGLDTRRAKAAPQAAIELGASR